MGSVDKQYPNNCKKFLEALDRSPTFAMSLGAKELFHTNFLAFLLESNDDALKGVREALINLLFGEKIGPVVTWREKSNLDLVIVPRSCIEAASTGRGNSECSSEAIIAVVIEAKLKSLPDAGQLKSYDGKLGRGIDLELDDIDWDNAEAAEVGIIKLKLAEVKQGGGGLLWVPNKKKQGCYGKIRRVLLSPDRTALTDSDGWDKVPWETLKLTMNGAQVLPSLTEWLSQVVNDYRNSLGNLLSVLEKAAEYVDTAVGEKNATFGAFYDAITDSGFRHRRIHDLVGKYASSLLERHVRDNLSTETRNGIRSATIFTRQQPGIEFEWCKSTLVEEIRVGVQIQGKQYRHYVCVKGDDKRSREQTLKNILGALDDWLAQKGFSGKGKGSKEHVELHAYDRDNENFRYTKADISTFLLSELAESIHDSLKTAKETIDQIDIPVNTTTT